MLDNLREGVLVPDVYDATLNPLYRDVLAHYGAVALPCRIQDPDRKARWSQPWATPREPLSKDNASRVWNRLDGCVEVEAAYYGLPPGWIGGGVKVQWDELCVRILDPKSGLLLRELYGRNGAGTAFSPRTTPSELRSVWYD